MEGRKARKPRNPDEGCYLPPPWRIRLECAKIRAAREAELHESRGARIGGIREYTYKDLGLRGTLEVD